MNGKLKFTEISPATSTTCGAILRQKVKDRTSIQSSETKWLVAQKWKATESRNWWKAILGDCSMWQVKMVQSENGAI